MGGDTRDNYQSLVTLSITRMTLTHTLFVVINPFFLFFLSIIRITLTHTLLVVINAEQSSCSFVKTKVEQRNVSSLVRLVCVFITAVVCEYRMCQA